MGKMWVPLCLWERHSFYHTPQKSSRIKNVGQYFYTFTLLLLEDILEKLRGVLHSGQRYRETSYFGENSNSKNAPFSWALPCLSIQSSSQTNHSHALALPAQRKAADLPTILDLPVARLPINTLQQQNMCVCFQRKGLPWAVPKLLGFPLPANSCRHRAPWASPPGTSLSARSTMGTAQENIYKVGTSLQWSRLNFGIF